jgi:hypothetical protein
MTDVLRRAVYAAFGGLVIGWMGGSIVGWVIGSIGLYVLMTVWGDSGPTQM